MQHDESDYLTFMRISPVTAVCQSAFLLMFKYYGYDFARHPSYSFLRQQILRPDEEVSTDNIIVLPPDVSNQFLEGNQAAVVFLREPQQAILAVLRFKSPGGIDEVLAVGLPGLDQPPIAALNLSGAVFCVAEADPEYVRNQVGSLWLDWNSWLRS
jgi:hypothetical protein